MDPLTSTYIHPEYLLIIFTLLFTSGSWCDLTEINYISLHNKLENYKWKKRILLLITKKEDTVLVNEVNKAHYQILVTIIKQLSARFLI